MIKKEKKYYSFCTGCGMPMEKYQIAAAMDDTTVLDFESRQFVTFDGHFCSECWSKMKQNNLGGMEFALKKLKNLDKLQNTQNL